MGHPVCICKFGVFWISYLRSDAREILRVRDPVVVLESVHRLQDGGDAPHVRVDLRVREKLCRQVRVQLDLQNKYSAYRL